jgi:acetyl esterase/lipase
MWFRFVGLILFVLPFAAEVAAQTREPEFTVLSDVQYCTGGGRPLLMDVFIPKHRNRTPTPAVLWIHGGGWEARR